MNVECSFINILPPNYSHPLKYQFCEELRFQEIECPDFYLNTDCTNYEN